MGTKMVEEIRKKYGLYDDSSSSFHFDTTEESEQNQQPEAAAQVLQMQAAPPVIEEEKPAAEASEKMNIDIPVSPDLNEGSQEDEVMIFQNHIEIQPEPQAAVEEEEAIETAMQAPQVSSPKEKKLSLVSALKKEIQKCDEELGKMEKEDLEQADAEKMDLDNPVEEEKPVTSKTIPQFEEPPSKPVNYFVPLDK